MQFRTTSAVILVSITVLAETQGATIGGTGSLLIFPNIELSWDANGEVTQDTLITVANGANQPVHVRMYFVNGDPPLPAVYNQSGQLIERNHKGWNNFGCGFELSSYQSKYWSALTGQPGGCRFAALDSGPPPGRPDPEHPGGRVLRGFMYAWAVDADGREINWNHLRGDATIFQFADGGSWAYGATAFRALIGTRGQNMPDPGTLMLDGIEYEKAFQTLALSFSAAGEIPLFGDDRLFHVDTDLTLMPVSQDFRQDNSGPVLTKARFEIYNQEEDYRSGTERCVTCWDQTLLSRYDGPNHFLYEHLQTELGTARINGIPSTVVCGPNSRDAALLGAAVRVISFPTVARAADWTGDGMTSLDDHTALAGCLAGPEEEAPYDRCSPVFDLDGDGDVDFQDFGAMPFAVQASRSYSAVPLSGEGTKSAVIHYDAPQ